MAERRDQIAESDSVRSDEEYTDAVCKNREKEDVEVRAMNRSAEQAEEDPAEIADERGRR